MKKGINAWCFPSDLSLEGIFALAAECRFDALELNMSEAGGDGGGLSGIEQSESGGLTLGMSENGWAAIKSLSERYAIPISSISTALHWRYPLTDPDGATRDKGMRIVEEMLDAAAYLGCDSILVVPGAVTEHVSYQCAYDRSLDAFKSLKKHAETKKVAIGVENVWNKFLLSPLEMAAFIDKIGSDYAGAYFDAGNVLQFSYPQHWVESLGRRIVKVHIKDFDSGIGNITGFKPLLQGDMPWGKLMDALKSVGYDDYITAELSPYPTNPTQLIRDTSAAMDYILSL